MGAALAAGAAFPAESVPIRALGRLGHRAGLLLSVNGRVVFLPSHVVGAASAASSVLAIEAVPVLALLLILEPPLSRQSLPAVAGTFGNVFLILRHIHIMASTVASPALLAVEAVAVLARLRAFLGPELSSLSAGGSIPFVSSTLAQAVARIAVVCAAVASLPLLTVEAVAVLARAVLREPAMLSVAPLVRLSVGVVLLRGRSLANNGTIGAVGPSEAACSVITGKTQSTRAGLFLLGDGHW